MLEAVSRVSKLIRAWSTVEGVHRVEATSSGRIVKAEHVSTERVELVFAEAKAEAKAEAMHFFFYGVVAGLLVQNALKFLLKFGQVTPYLGYNSLKDYFPTMEMKPNPHCSNSVCLERQKEYLLAKPVRDALAKAKKETEISLENKSPLHLDNEWNISVVDDSEMETFNAPNSSDALPEGLTRELPSADQHQEAAVSISSNDFDIEELQRQLDALNAS